MGGPPLAIATLISGLQLLFYDLVYEQGCNPILLGFAVPYQLCWPPAELMSGLLAY